MNRFLTIAILLVGSSLSALAAEPKTELLWPNGAPGALGTEAKDKPMLTIYLPEKEKASGGAVVVCPGGGYAHLAITYEGHDIARWLADNGMTLTWRE